MENNILNDNEKSKIFFQIHSEWKKFMINKIYSKFKSNSEDVVQDYLIYFFDTHFKLFNWNWEQDVELAKSFNISVKDFVKIRAKNWYLQRFIWFLDSSCRRHNFLKRNYIGSDFDYNGYENIAYNSNNNSDEFCNISEYRKVIFSNELNNNIDFKIYVEQLISYIYLNVNNIRDKSKIKILKYLNDFLLYDKPNISDYFNNTILTKKLILKIINTFDSVNKKLVLN